jgi:hypothetical protein
MKVRSGNGAIDGPTVPSSCSVMETKRSHLHINISTKFAHTVNVSYHIVVVVADLSRVSSPCLETMTMPCFARVETSSKPNF